MNPSEIADLFEQYPTTPFRLTLASGDTVIVHSPQRTLVDTMMIHVGLGNDPRMRMAAGVKYVSIPNITMIEPIDPNSPQVGRRRRRQ